MSMPAFEENDNSCNKLKNVRKKVERLRLGAEKALGKEMNKCQRYSYRGSSR